MHLKKALLTIAFLVFFINPNAKAEEPNPAPGAPIDGHKIDEDNKGIFSLVFENDIFSGHDANYTNGIRLGWISPETNVPDWLRWSADWLPLDSSGNKRYSVAVGQSLFTPSNILTAAPQPGERPYAGWLYGSVGALSDTGTTLDNVMLTLGVVGPAALGRQTQTDVHRIIGDDKPQGWDNQIKNEAGVELDYERKWRGILEFSPFGLGVDIIPHVAANLGNIYTQAIAGATMRIGYDLPQDYGPPRIRPSVPGSDFFIPSKEFGGYLFLGTEGRAVARNIFLDGNTFRDSASVDKENFVGSLSAGIAFTIDDTRISYTHVFMTDEYKTQAAPERFGVITVSTRF